MDRRIKARSHVVVGSIVFVDQVHVSSSFFSSFSCNKLKYAYQYQLKREHENHVISFEAIYIRIWWRFPARPDSLNKKKKYNALATVRMSDKFFSRVRGPLPPALGKLSHYEQEQGVQGDVLP
jgi:hypothetical protein